MAETETSGSGGGGTSWSSISISTMWAWVNRDLAPYYNQASSWEKTSELCGLYSRRLEAFRERLAQSWNPDNSHASQAFLTKLDELITSVKDVNTVASNNYQPAKDIASAIAEAKRNLEPYYNQAQQAETPQDYENAQRNAARVMGVLSGDLSNARTGIGEPRPYVAPGRPGKDTGSDTGSGPPPPVIPPVMPVPPPQSPPPSMTPGPTAPMPAPRGPDLVGLNPPMPGPGPSPMQPMPPSNPPVGPGPVPPGPGPVIRPPVTGGPPPVAPVRPTPPTGRPIGPVTPPLPGPGRGPTTGIIGPQPPTAGNRGPGGLRANPPGGMIGSPNTGRPGAAGALGAAGRGVVGGPGAAGVAGRGPGAAGAAARGALVGGAGARGAGQHDEEGEHFDPDTAWDVAEGVAPVLDSPENQGPIDPGPAIGLSR